MKCLACNFNIEIGNNYCGSCGAKVEPINSCSECNIINDIGNKFCGGCGNNLNKTLKTITTVKIGTEKNSDIIQSLYNKDIPENEDVNFFNTKKLFNSTIGIIIYLILCFFIIPTIFVGLNFVIYGKGVGPISAMGGIAIINLTIFGFANRNIASNSNSNTNNAFWLGFLGPLGLVICLFNSVKLSQKKILLGILRFLIFAIALQLLGELGIISNAGKGLLLYFFGFTFILRGLNMFNYSVKKIL